MIGLCSGNVRSTHAKAHLAYGECFANAIPGSGDDDTSEDLDSRAGALDDLDVDLDGIARTEGGKIASIDDWSSS